MNQRVSSNSKKSIFCPDNGWSSCKRSWPWCQCKTKEPLSTFLFWPVGVLMLILWRLLIHRSKLHHQVHTPEVLLMQCISGLRTTWTTLPSQHPLLKLCLTFSLLFACEACHLSTQLLHEECLQCIGSISISMRIFMYKATMNAWIRQKLRDACANNDLHMYIYI